MHLMRKGGYFHSLKVSLHRLFTSCKRKNSKYAEKKLGNTFDQAIKISIISEGQVDTMCLQM